MVGPVLHHEMMLGSRRSRAYVFRWIYGGWLALQVLWFYLTYSMSTLFAASSRSTTPAVAEWFVETFVVQQLILLVLATPVFAAGAVTDEKTRGTLQYLLTTDLQAWHLLVGKLLGRVSQVALIALTGLPLLCFFGVFAGLEPLTLLAVLLVTLGPMLALGAASLLASVWCRQTRDAVIGLYVLGGLAFGFLVWRKSDLLYLFNPLYVLAPAWGRQNVADLEEVMRRLFLSALAWGGVAVVCLGLAVWRLRPAYIHQLEHAGVRRPGLTGFRLAAQLAALVAAGGGGALLWWSGQQSGWASAVVADLFWVCVFAAGGLVLGLLWQVVGSVGAAAEAGESWWRARRGPIPDNPVPWKEQQVEGLAPVNLLRRIPTWLAMLTIFLATITSSLLILMTYSGRSFSLGELLDLARQGRLDEVVYLFMPAPNGATPEGPFLMQAIVAMLLASLVVGIRCSGAICGEREKQTWEALLLTPLTARQLVRGKLWGILGSTHLYLLAYAFPALTLSGVGGFLPFFWTTVWLAVTWLAMYFVGAAGLWCSVRAKSSWRSLLSTLGISYVGGIILYGVTTPVIFILALLILLLLFLIDRYLQTSLGMAAVRGFNEFLTAFTVASSLTLAGIFFGLARYFLADAQKYVADRERTRHWKDEPILKPRRKPVAAKPRYYR